MKKTNKTLLMLLFALLLVSCSNPKDSNDSKDTNKQEENGDGSSATTTLSEDIDVESVEIDEVSYSSDNIINVDLNNIVTTSNYEYSNNVLAFKNAGVYELSGSLNGCIEVNKKNIHLILAGVTITPLDTQYTGALVYKKENTNNLSLTIKENTINTLYDSVNDIESYNADADEGVIVVKSLTTLTIQGKGTLNINTNSSDSSGIKVKNTNLSIIDTTININATKNGIKSGKGLFVKNAKINITAGNDGMKTDMVADNSTDALLYASDINYGYIEIIDSDITITSGDDGIAADSYMYIDNNSHTINIITNSGAPSSISERSSDSANGKAIKVGGIKMEVNDVETDYLSSSELGYYLIINSGNFTINSNDDAIHSNGSLLINDGTFNIATGDDGLHSEYLTKIVNGDITISKCYEGIEGAVVEIFGGSLDVTSTDDGINAANGDLTNYTYYIYIGGGIVNVNAKGDGIDSNGVIEFNGGTTYVFGPTDNGNASLDADKGILINGGTVIAIGSSGMVEKPSTSSKQCIVGWNLTSSMSANTNVVFSVNNEEKININAPKTFSSIIVSTANLKSGDSIMLRCGSQSKSTTINATLTTYGTFSSMGGGGMGPSGGGGFNGGGPIGGPGFRRF